MTSHRPTTALTSAELADPRWRRLARLLARTQFGTGSGSDVVDWAVDALAAGWESPSLAVLAGLDKPPNELEVDRYVERALTELGIEMPRGPQVVQLYAVAIAGDILAGTSSPYEGAREMFRICVAANSRTSFARGWGSKTATSSLATAYTGAWTASSRRSGTQRGAWSAVCQTLR